jgi:hypothetical protein
MARARVSVYHRCAALHGAGRWAALIAAAVCAPAHAELSCEQLFAVVKRSIEFRDEGYSLQQVLTALKADSEGKFTTEEAEVLRKTVNAVYLGSASAEEIALACAEGRNRK